VFASDILISDYSGLVYDFSLMKKPVFLYAKDYSEYITERNFYIDLHSLPFPFAKDMNTLIDNITHFNQQEYNEKLESFFQKIGCIDDGKASERVVNRIIEEICR
jgi:CDP-glycerol glycerophosphotransferase